MVSNTPGLAVASVYLKRGVKNILAKESNNIRGVIDNISLFICDENGNIDMDTLFKDFISALRNIQETPFNYGFIHGVVGKGVIRFTIPDNPITGLLFGDTRAIRITDTDIISLKEMFMKE